MFLQLDNFLLAKGLSRPLGLRANFLLAKGFSRPRVIVH
jgi:hypothetical protein